MRMTLSIRFMLEQFEQLEALGFIRERAMRAAQVTQENCENPLHRISLDRMLNVFNHAENVIKDRNVGLNAGFKFRVAAYTKTGNIYGYCRNITHVIKTNAQYQQLAIDAGHISYEQKLDEQTRHIRHFMIFRPYIDNVQMYRHVIDSIAGAYCTTYRWLSWSSGQDILQVDLPYDAPADTSVHKRLFKCPVRFNQPYLRLEFSEKTMYHELTSHDPEKFSQLELHLNSLLKTTTLCNSLKTAVKMAMRAALNNGKIGTHIVAERMGKTWSVLRSELLESNLSYRELLETVRQDIFHECLEKDKPLSQIAQELGYNDQAAFSKAFKRWYGVSPRQWKAAYQIALMNQPGYTTLT
ncbi:MAG: AraC family transcriptional regulator ligand-binding domain-containing protein [Litorimonas sp.]